MEKAKELADEHWKFLDGLLAYLPDQNFTLITVEYLYKQAFIHGWKHAKNENNRKD